MKIVISSWWEKGGIALYAKNIRKGLIDLGMEVEFVSGNVIPSPLRVFLITLEEILNNSGILSIFKLIPMFLLVLLYAIFALPYFIKTDIVIAQSHYCIFSYSLLKKIIKKPVIFAHHGSGRYIFEKLKSDEKIIYHLLKKAYTTGNAIITPSYLEKRLFENIFQVKVKKIIYNGVNLTEIDKIPPLKLKGKPVIIFVGGRTYIKGFDILVQAFDDILGKLPNARLYMIMYAGYACDIKINMDTIREKTVIIKGLLPHKYVIALLKGSDITVVPSRYESFSMLALEALAVGKPTIISKYAGIAEIVRNYHNAIVAYPCPKSFSNFIIELWTNKELNRKLAINSKKLANNFSWRNIAFEYLKLITEIVSREKRI